MLSSLNVLHLNRKSDVAHCYRRESKRGKKAEREREEKCQLISHW